MGFVVRRDKEKVGHSHEPGGSRTQSDQGKQSRLLSRRLASNTREESCRISQARRQMAGDGGYRRRLFRQQLCQMVSRRRTRIQPRRPDQIPEEPSSRRKTRVGVKRHCLTRITWLGHVSATGPTRHDLPIFLATPADSSIFGTALFSLSFFWPFAPALLLLCTVDTVDSYPYRARSNNLDQPPGMLVPRGRTADRAYSVPFPVDVWNPVIPLAHMSGTFPD